MAYFDSAKNRAHWQTELNGLMAEREKREKGFVSDKSMNVFGKTGVEKITFAQLEAEARAKRIEARKEKGLAPERQREKRQPERAAVSKHTPSKGMGL